MEGTLKCLSRFHSWQILFPKTPVLLYIRPTSQYLYRHRVLILDAEQLFLIQWKVFPMCRRQRSHFFIIRQYFLDYCRIQYQEITAHEIKGWRPPAHMKELSCSLQGRKEMMQNCLLLYKLPERIEDLELHIRTPSGSGKFARSAKIFKPWHTVGEQFLSVARRTHD